MSFANPLAWFGLATVAVPIAVHLLARHRGPRTAFPTLRFFEVDRLVALRRYQLTDLLLMAVRIAVMVFAVLALAGPRLAMWASPLGPAQPAIAILVDTSESTSRPGRDGRPAIEAARAQAARLKRSSDRTTVIDATDVGAAVAGASAWLDTQAAPRELVIISDFQRGALSESDLRQVPVAMGIRVIPLEIAAASSVAAPAIWRDDENGELREHTPRITLRPDQTDVAWIAGPDLAADPSRAFDLDPMLAFVASATDTPRAFAALRAVMGQGARSGSRERPVAMVFAGATGHGALWERSAPLDRPWMVDVVQQLATDPSVRDAAQHTRASAHADMRDGLVTVARDGGQAPLVVAASGDVGQAHRLLLFFEGDAASLASALVMQATLRATSGDAPMGELEPLAVDAGTLRSWERAPTPSPAGQPTHAEPAGRWVWGVVLLWLGAETWMRRDRRERQAGDGPMAGAGNEVTHDLVA